MNVFTHLPFLRDYQSAIHHLDDRGRAFARGYGNAIASAQAFAPLGKAASAAATVRSTRAAPAVASKPQPAPARTRRAPRELCTGGACG